MNDIEGLPDGEFEALYQAVNVEMGRRRELASIPPQVNALNVAYLAAEGIGPGDPWRQPGGAYDAYPLGAVVTHAGTTWESLVPANVWQPGAPESWNLWKDLGAGDGAGGDAWAAGTAYDVGDEVVYDGVRYRCTQAHTATPGWEPPHVPALWTVA